MNVVYIKNQADILKKFLKEKGIDIKHSHALEAISKINGFKDWNNLSAYLSKNENKQEA